jgi:phthalate 4,5-cis-dihydrodiol dehydrogenase
VVALWTDHAFDSIRYARTVSDEPLRLGLIGVGVGARQLLPALTQHPHVRLYAAADIRPAALERLHDEFGIKTFLDADALCAQPDVDVVWVASPNHLHAQHVIAAAERGKHVIVSKPMAVTLEEAEAMNAAAERHGVVLLAGHTQSMAPSIRRMAAMVRSGELGKLGMVHTWHFTDWMYRPRLPDELDAARGGGPAFRQASHQVDMIRLIAGRRLHSVRASTMQLDPARPVAGAYTAYFEFDDGTPATIVYSGYGHFDLTAFLRGSEADARPVANTGDDAQRKEALRYGGATASAGSNSLGLFGLTIASCAEGDIRESTEGLFVYGRAGRRAVRVDDESRGQAELDELYAAVRRGRPAMHGGRWGEATLEACLAIHESARTHREVILSRQTAPGEAL